VLAQLWKENVAFRIARRRGLAKIVASNALETRSLLQITFTRLHLVVGVEEVILEKG
jgi:hypothetical protein